MLLLCKMLVGPQAQPAVKVASRVRVGYVQLRFWAFSPLPGSRYAVAI